MERFTIVIPTLNRCETLAHTLETCIAQEDGNFEILVSDNHSTDATAEVLADFRSRDPRIRVVQPPRRVGMADHWEFALGNVESGFFMVLGSDDGILPSAVATSRKYLAQNPGAKALHCGLHAVYCYPGTYGAWSDCLILYFTRALDTRGVHERLQKAAAADEYNSVPFCYNFGWLSTTVTDELVKRTGRRISSPFPDSYLAVATACVIKDEELVAIPPVGVLGFSGKSTGSSFVKLDAPSEIQSAFYEGNTVALHPKTLYTPALDFHFGDAFLRAEELGLLPPGITINWEKRVARAYAEFEGVLGSEEERATKLQLLREQAEIHGCSHVLEEAARFPDVSAWLARLPCSLETEDAPPDLTLDTAPLKLRGIHDAVKLAGGLVEAVRKGASAHSFAEATPADLQNWAMTNLVKERRDLRTKWIATSQELGLQLTEQDATRIELKKEQDKLQATRAKLEETKAKLTAARQALARLKGTRTPSRGYSWIPKWLRL